MLWDDHDSRHRVPVAGGRVIYLRNVGVSLERGDGGKSAGRVGKVAWFAVLRNDIDQNKTGPALRPDPFFELELRPNYARRRSKPTRPRPAPIRTRVVGSGAEESVTAPWIEVWPMGLPTVGA